MPQPGASSPDQLTLARLPDRTRTEPGSAPRPRWGRRLLSGPVPWVLPAVLVIVFVQVGPMLYALWLSLFEKYAFSPVGEFVGPGNYITALSDPDFWLAAGFGIVFAALAVACQLLLGLALALLLHRQFRGRGLVRGLVILPYMVPTASMALVFAFMGNDLYGIVNQMLVDTGILERAVPFFGDASWVLPSILLASTWKWTPFTVIIVLARLQTIDQSLYESARVEGAGSMRCFLDVTLPSLRSTLMLVLLLRSIWMFNKFDIPFLLTEGGPGSATTNLPIHAYDVTFLDAQQGQGSALAVVMFVALLIFALTYSSIVKPEREVVTE